MQFFVYVLYRAGCIGVDRGVTADYLNSLNQGGMIIGDTPIHTIDQHYKRLRINHTKPNKYRYIINTFLYLKLGI